jgi:hypothetical protein
LRDGHQLPPHSVDRLGQSADVHVPQVRGSVA